MARQTRKPAQSLAGVKSKALDEAAELGLELIDVAIVRENTGSVLRFTIDSEQEGGVTLDDCEKYHKRVQKYAQDIEYDYMEVTSPGADRPLKSDRDFERALGQGVQVNFYRQIDGAKQLKGVLTAYDADAITLDMAGTPKQVERKDISLVRLTLDEEELSSPLFDALEREEAQTEAPTGGNGENIDDGGKSQT